MKKIGLYLSSLIIAFTVGWILSYYLREPEIVTIYEKPIIANTIDKDPYKIPYSEAMSDLNCFYTGFPTLTINHIEGDEYLQSASLCERKWQRQTTIKSVSKQYNHMVIAGLFFDSEMRLGFQGQYYRMFGRFGFGGGLAWTQGYGSVSAGVVLGW